MYVTHWSLSEDFKLLLRTIPAAVRRRSAYEMHGKAMSSELGASSGISARQPSRFSSASPQVPAGTFAKRTHTSWSPPVTMTTSVERSRRHGWCIPTDRQSAGSRVNSVRIAPKESPVPELMTRLFEMGVPVGLRHFLFGSTPDVIDRLRKALSARHPQANIVGTLAPPFGHSLEKDATYHVETMRDAAPDVVWCALGAPKQELWMNRHAALLAPAVVIGVWGRIRLPRRDEATRPRVDAAARP